MKFDFKIKNKTKMVQVGFEPTPPKRLELESSALDHSAIEPLCNNYSQQSIMFLPYQFKNSNNLLKFTKNK